MNILLKITKNNRDKHQMKFLVFNIFLLNAHKIRKLENKFAEQHKLCSSTVFLSDKGATQNNQTCCKKLDLSKLLINLVYCGTYHGYYVVILVLTFQ